MVLIGENVLLQKLLEDGEFDSDLRRLLRSLNEERLLTLYKIAEAMARLREASLLLEMKEDEEDIVLDRHSYFEAISKMSESDRILKESVNYMEKLFSEDSELRDLEIEVAKLKGEYYDEDEDLNAPYICEDYGARMDRLSGG